jgi:drug/metabolite transporter (DMT)-like permease
LKTAPAVSAAAVFTLTPVMAAGFGWAFLRQRLTGRMALALAIGGAGALWVIFRADLQALMALEIGRGEVIYFVGCIAHAAYAPLVRKLNRGEPAVVFTFGMMLAGTVLLAVYAGPAVLATDWTALPGIVWVTLVYVAVAASAMTFVLLQYATLRLPAAKVMAYTYLVPSWVILWEIALHGAVPPGLVLGGVALTALALGLLLKE